MEKYEIYIYVLWYIEIYFEGYKFKVVEYSMRIIYIFILIKKYLLLEV